MNKPNKECEIKLTDAEIAQAIQLLLNENQHYHNLVVTSVSKTRSKEWFLIARFK